MTPFFYKNRQSLIYFYLNCTPITIEVIHLTNFSIFQHFFRDFIHYVQISGTWRQCPLFWFCFHGVNKILLEKIPYIFSSFFLEKLTYVQDGSYYIVPFLDLIRDDYTKTQYVSTQKNIKIVDDPDYNIHTLSILSDYLIDEASIVTKEYS